MLVTKFFYKNSICNCIVVHSTHTHYSLSYNAVTLTHIIHNIYSKISLIKTLSPFLSLHTYVVILCIHIYVYIHVRVEDIPRRSKVTFHNVVVLKSTEAAKVMLCRRANGTIIPLKCINATGTNIESD